MTLPIVRPYHPKLGMLATEFNRALQSGQVTNNGEHVQEFERALTHILGCPTLAFNNGMSALIAMLMASDVQGMEVIVPSFTFAATPHAVVLAGAKPVFADIDPDTLCLDPADVERKITPYTAAIMPVDPYGILWQRPASWEKIDYPILIDAAPSFGSEPIGLRGDAQIYSFHATKPFSTMEGGALCSSNPALLDRAAAIRNFGQGPDGDCAAVGFNGKMAEANALVGLRNLDTWHYRATARVESAMRLRKALAGITGLRVQKAPEGQSPIWTYQPVFVEPTFGKSRDEVVAGLRARGIGVRVYYRPCHELTCYGLAYEVDEFPVTERLASQVIALPVYDAMTATEIDQIAEAFRSIRCE